MAYSLLKSYLNVEEAKEIRKSLLVMALPAIGENVLQMLLGISDTAFLGHYDWRIMTAVGTANQVVFIFQAVLVAISTGSMVLISNSYGAGNRQRVNLIAWHAIYLSATTGLALSFGSLFSENLLSLLFPSSDSFMQLNGSDYLRIIMAGFPAMSIMIVLGATLRGSGDTRSPLIVALVANVLNVFLDYAMIFGKLGFPEMGAFGAALATVLSRVVGSVIIIVLLFRNRRISMSRKPQRFSKWLFKEIFILGLPASIENFGFSLGVLVFANILFIAGPEAYAAHRIGIQVESLSFMPAWGMGVAITALVGIYNGGRQRRMSIGVVRQGWFIALAISSAIGFAITLFPDLFISLFTNESSLIEEGRLPVRIIGLFQVVMGTDYAVTGALRGMGDTSFPMKSSLVAMWFLRLPIGYLLVRYFNLGLFGAWIGMMADMAFRTTLKFIRFYSGRWESTADSIQARSN
ncbi:MAG TPA: MATE family efflux transporter [Mesotoga infera]|uniref:Multidrug-efflux transporter n=1 Tax=Mesotoga infera TaxID=1236046 RepID=A0A7C1H627_9BACT|nr:MATE family efflux transporter [Mesotoga infera]